MLRAFLCIYFFSRRQQRGPLVQASRGIYVCVWGGGGPKHRFKSPGNGLGGQGGRWGADNRATVGVAASLHGDGGAGGDIRWN